MDNLQQEAENLFYKIYGKDSEWNAFPNHSDKNVFVASFLDTMESDYAHNEKINFAIEILEDLKRSSASMAELGSFENIYSKIQELQNQLKCQTKN